MVSIVSEVYIWRVLNNSFKFSSRSLCMRFGEVQGERAEEMSSSLYEMNKNNNDAIIATASLKWMSLYDLCFFDQHSIQPNHIRKERRRRRKETSRIRRAKRKTFIHFYPILFKVKLASITMQIGSKNAILSEKKSSEIGFHMNEMKECIIYQAVYGLKTF